MSLSIIVMGASGRMGTTIANLAKEQGMTLAAVLERQIGRASCRERV